MPELNELNRAIGRLEASIETLFHKNTELCKEVKVLGETIRGRKFWDSVKVISGGVIGGFAAVAAKFAITK